MIPIEPKAEIVEEYKDNIIKYILSKRGGKKKLDTINKNLSKIMKGVSLEKLIIMPYENLNSLTQNFSKLQKQNIQFLFRIFKTYYKNFFANENGAKFVSNLGVEVCPYCNRNYIFSVDKRRTAQLDHFISKDKYPIFALCFYNLVPSCPTCNGFKSNKETNLINPYDKKLTNKTFEFYPQPKYPYNGKFDIILKSENKKALKDMNEELKLQKLYLHHSYLADELYQKYLVFSDGYIDSLRNLFFAKLGYSNFKKTDFIRFILENYGSDKDFLKRPLSKATKDIAIKFGLLEKEHQT